MLAPPPYNELVEYITELKKRNPIKKKKKKGYGMHPNPLKQRKYISWAHESSFSLPASSPQEPGHGQGVWAILSRCASPQQGTEHWQEPEGIYTPRARAARALSINGRLNSPG